MFEPKAVFCTKKDRWDLLLQVGFWVFQCILVLKLIVVASHTYVISRREASIELGFQVKAVLLPEHVPWKRWTKEDEG